MSNFEDGCKKLPIELTALKQSLLMTFNSVSGTINSRSGYVAFSTNFQSLFGFLFFKGSSESFEDSQSNSSDPPSNELESER